MKKLTDFFDASREWSKLKNAKIIYNGKADVWWRGLPSVFYQDSHDKNEGWASLIADNTRFWPSIEQQKEKAWQVEPEAPKEVFVWGACDDDRQSWLFDEEPKKDGSDWQLPGGHGDNCMQIETENLFPKDKPKRYRLVPDNHPLFSKL